MRPLTSLSSGALIVALVAPLCAQQTVVFSVEAGGASTLPPGDLLAPASGQPALAPTGPPSLAGSAASLGLPPNAEVNALSYGRDGMARATPPEVPSIWAGRLFFSVEDGSSGAPMPAPSVGTEAPLADAAADAFTNKMGLATGPLGPPGPFWTGGEHVGTIDGDGAPHVNGIAYPGLGLIEGVLGDNVDAIDVIEPFTTAGTYFSLANAADVLFAPGGGGAFVVYAQANALGLGESGVNDLDALILLENGNGVYEPSNPYGWAGGNTDMLLFSVTSGSGIIGTPDAFFGAPIAEGDLLLGPLVPGMVPGIFIAAEHLGLAAFRGMGKKFQGDDLDAADLVDEPLFDCNGNGVEDSVDIATGVASDMNQNGVPDPCDPVVFTTFCHCEDAGPGPCGNGPNDPVAGCRNSTGSGATLLPSGGTASISADDLEMTMMAGGTSLAGNLAWLQVSAQSVAPFQPRLHEGYLCLANPARFAAGPIDTAGNYTVGPGLVGAYQTATGSPFVAGTTYYFQVGYRDDPNSPCEFDPHQINYSNGVAITFAP